MLSMIKYLWPTLAVFLSLLCTAHAQKYEREAPLFQGARRGALRSAVGPAYQLVLVTIPRISN